MTDLVYTGIFTKGGKEVFRSQMVAGYSPMVTGMFFLFVAAFHDIPLFDF